MAERAESTELHLVLVDVVVVGIVRWLVGLRMIDVEAEMFGHPCL